MAYKYEAPFADPKEPRPEDTQKKQRSKVKKLVSQKHRLKKEKWRYDGENTGGPYFFNSQDFPVRSDGEYAGYSIGEIRVRIGKLFSEKRRAGEKPDYPASVHQVLDELGYPQEKWKRKAIFSALSKELWRRRKTRGAELKQKKLEEAHQAKLALGVSAND